MNRREAIVGTVAALVVGTAAKQAEAAAPAVVPEVPVGRLIIDGQLLPEGWKFCLYGRHPLPGAEGLLGLAHRTKTAHHHCYFSEKFA